LYGIIYVTEDMEKTIACIEPATADEIVTERLSTLQHRMSTNIDRMLTAAPWMSIATPALRR